MDRKEKEIRENLGTISEKMKGILSRAENESRNLKEDEQDRFDGLKADWEAKKQTLANYTATKSTEEFANANAGAVPIAGENGSTKNGSNKQKEPEGQSWETKDGQNLRVYSPDEKMSSENAVVSLGQMARSMLTGTRNAAEKRALAEGTDSAGGFTVPHATLTNFFDRLRSKSRVIQAGARTIQLETDKTTIAKVATDPTVIWHAENTKESDSDITFEGKTLRSRTMMILVRASREMVADSQNINAVMDSVFAGSIGSALDNGILFGAGGDEIDGISTYGIAEVAQGGAITNYDPLVSAYRKMLDNNAEAPTAFIMAPREWETLATLKDSNLRYLDRPQALDGIPFYDTTHVATDGGVGTNESSIITGNFADLVIGMRSEMRIELLRDRFADSYQFGFLAHMRVDAVPAHDGSFAKITGITP